MPGAEVVADASPAARSHPGIGAAGTLAAVAASTAEVAVAVRIRTGTGSAVGSGLYVASTMPHMVPSVTGLRIVRPLNTAIAEHHLATASDHVRNVRRLGPECVSVAQEGSVPGGTMPHLGGALSGRIAAHGPVLASASRIRGAGVCIMGRAPVGAGCRGLRTCQGCDATSGRCHIWSRCHIWASASHEGVCARGACDQVGLARTLCSRSVIQTCRKPPGAAPPPGSTVPGPAPR